MDKHFVPRMYKKTYEIGTGLYSKAIADMNGRQGVVRPYYVSSLDDVDRGDRTIRDCYQYDKIGKHISDHRLKCQMEANAAEHDRKIRKALTPDFTRFQCVDGPFVRSVGTNSDPDPAALRHAHHMKMMENRKLYSDYLDWEQIKEQENRDRTRQLFRPELGAFPELPYNKAYKKPDLYY